MKLKKIIVGINKEDILNFFKLQNKISITNVNIDNEIAISGGITLLGKNVTFDSILTLAKVENNNVYLNLKNFNVLGLNILNPLTKKAFNYVINVFTDIDGISFEENDFKLEVKKIIKKHGKNQNIINLDMVELIEVIIANSEIEMVFGGIDIDTKVNTNIDDKIYDVSFEEI